MVDDENRNYIFNTINVLIRFKQQLCVWIKYFFVIFLKIRFEIISGMQKVYL